MKQRSQQKVWFLFWFFKYFQNIHLFKWFKFSIFHNKNSIFSLILIFRDRLWTSVFSPLFVHFVSFLSESTTNKIDPSSKSMSNVVNEIFNFDIQMRHSFSKNWKLFEILLNVASHSSPPLCFDCVPDSNSNVSSKNDEPKISSVLFFNRIIPHNEENFQFSIQQNAVKNAVN